MGEQVASCQEFDVHTASQAATLIEPLSQLAIVGNDASSEVHGELITLSQLLAKLISIKESLSSFSKTFSALSKIKAPATGSRGFRADVLDSYIAELSNNIAAVGHPCIHVLLRVGAAATKPILLQLLRTELDERIIGIVTRAMSCATRPELSRSSSL
ncbi:unnamed protein product [Sphagnum balticum]